MKKMILLVGKEISRQRTDTMKELDYKSLFPYYFEDDVKPVLSTTTTIWMESSDDILKVICENIGDISSLVNLSYTCKIMRDSVINTTLYKEKKQEKENSDLCRKIDDLLIDKIVKQNHWDDPLWRTRLFRLKKADVSDIEMMIDEEKKKLNKGCLKTLELIIDGDYCDWQHSRNPNERLLAEAKSPLIKEMIIEIDADYKIREWWSDDFEEHVDYEIDNWWYDDFEEQSDDYDEDNGGFDY